MNKNEIELSGAAVDVLYALFFRGALENGDLPSKGGAAELRELDLAVTKQTETKFGGGDYFTYLTAKGQDHAISFLAESNFGKGKDARNHTVTIQITLDTSPALEQLEATKEALDGIFKNKIRSELQPGGLLHRR